MATNSQERSNEQGTTAPSVAPLDGELTAELLTAKNFLGYGYDRSRKTIEREAWQVHDSEIRIGSKEHIKAYAIGSNESESFEKLRSKYVFLSDITIPVKNMANPNVKTSLNHEKDNESQASSKRQCYSFIRYKKVYASIKRFPTSRNGVIESGDSFVKSGCIYIGYQITMTAQFENAESKGKSATKAETGAKIASVYNVDTNADWGADFSKGRKASNVQISVVSHGVVLPALQTFYKDMETAITALNSIESEFKAMISVPQPGAKFIIDLSNDLEVYPTLGRKTVAQDTSKVADDLGSWEYLSRQIREQMQGTSKRLVELFSMSVKDCPEPASKYTQEQKEVLGLKQFFKGLSEFVARAAYDAANETLANKKKMMILGCSGAGKSSLVAALLGSPLCTKEIRSGQWVVDYADGVIEHPARPKIGHERSETEGCIIYQKPDVPYAYLDCAGFEDTKGYAADINNAKAVSILLERHSVECIIVVLKPEDFRTGTARGQDFIKIMKQVASLSTHSEPNKIWSSVLFVVNGPVVNPVNDSAFEDNIQAQAQLVRQIRTIQEIWNDDRSVHDLLGQWLHSFSDRLVVANLKKDHGMIKSILENKIQACITARTERLGKPNIEAYYAKGFPVDQDFVEILSRITSHFNLLRERYARYESEIQLLQTPNRSSNDNYIDEVSLNKQKTELETQRKKLHNNSTPKDLLPFSSNKPITHYYFSAEEFLFEYNRGIPYVGGRLYPSEISHLGTFREDGGNHQDNAVYKAYFSPCHALSPSRLIGKSTVSDARVVVSVKTKDHPDIHVEIDELTAEIRDIEDKLGQAAAYKDRKALGAEQVSHEIEVIKSKKDAISDELSAYEFFCSRLSSIIQTLKLNTSKDKNSTRFNKFLENFSVEKLQKKMSYSSESKTHTAAPGVSPKKSGLYPEIDVSRRLRQAAGNGLDAELRRLLTSDRNIVNVIDNKEDKGWTALHWAVYCGQVTCVRVLTEFDASYTIQDKSAGHMTSIDIAISKNNRAVIEVLSAYIRNKIVSSSDKNDGKVIRNATNQEDIEAIKLLVHDGIDVDSQSPSNYQTALHIASEKGFERIVKFLLEHGARTDITDSQGKYAEDYAKGHESILKLFREHRCDVEHVY
jgi:hypothetical protein